ncbi:hypothetical protein [Chryseobacterium sp. BIGb0232]|uniref:hypothetical protein n=1 Tax=Chryseobacterium sp. BIGb0232 TaxID=2940598 RepID=UPI000F474475|nr:hypothetical protein [Chryseobacterium sp. BIGb0232]MCS4301325.1 hypothetical protein [Chryseobacterium sp. BIGb0232]ROS19815.1 hypothetical protein EDF65_0513 [Chryseobacterium nakagawai]
MKQLFFILLFISVGIQAQIKKTDSGKRSNIENKKRFKSYKKAGNYGIKSSKDDQVKRIINLSQQTDNSKKEIVKKNDNGGLIIYEERSSVRYRMYLFIGLDAGTDSFLRDNKLMTRGI